MMRWGYVLAALYAAFGVLGLYFGVRMRHEMKRGKDWPTTPARILSRQVVRDPGARSGKSIYRPEVKYAYTVGGVEYVSDHVYQIGLVSDTRQGAQQFIDGLTDPFPVHYDPKDPRQSYILANPQWPYWAALGMGVFALFVALVQAVSTANPGPVKP